MLRRVNRGIEIVAERFAVGGLNVVGNLHLHRGTEIGNFEEEMKSVIGQLRAL